MKISRCFAALLAAFCSITGRAQLTYHHPYIPIPEDSAMWIVEWENWHESEPNRPHTFSYIVIRTEGQDTIFQGQRCFPLAGYKSNPLPAPGNQPMGFDFFRNDTADKTFSWYAYNNPPEVINDFSLAEGDTVQNPNHRYLKPNRYLDRKSYVHKVDSVFWADGRWRYRWTFRTHLYQSGPPADVVQIEGMGYVEGIGYSDPLERYFPIKAYTSRLICFAEKGQWLYSIPNVWGVSCDSLLNGNAIHALSVKEQASQATDERTQPMLYPNPVPAGGRAQLNRLCGNPVNTHTLTAYDALGRQCLRRAVRPGDAVDLSALREGVYFFRLHDDVRGVAVGVQRIVVR